MATMSAATTPTVVYHHPITKTEALRVPVMKSLITGQIAGLVSAIVFMLLFALNGVNPLYPLQVVGSLALGQAYLQDINAVAVIMGLIIHQAILSVILGLTFAAIANATAITTYAKAISVGIGLGIVSMIFPALMFPTLTVPLFGADIWNSEVPMTFSWITFLAFGAAFVAYPWVAQKVEAYRMRRNL